MSQPLNIIRLSQLVCECGGRAVRVPSNNGIYCFARCNSCGKTWYAYHCWNKLGCNKALIDGRYDKGCQHGGVSLVCSVCGKCRCESGFRQQPGRYDLASYEAIHEPEEVSEAVAYCRMNGIDEELLDLFGGSDDIESAWALEHWLDKD